MLVIWFFFALTKVPKSWKFKDSITICHIILYHVRILIIISKSASISSSQAGGKFVLVVLFTMSLSSIGIFDSKHWLRCQSIATLIISTKTSFSFIFWNHTLFKLKPSANLKANWWHMYIQWMFALNEKFNDLNGTFLADGAYFHLHGYVISRSGIVIIGQNKITGRNTKFLYVDWNHCFWTMTAQCITFFFK